MRKSRFCKWGMRAGAMLLSACMLAGSIPETLYAAQVAEVSVPGNVQEEALAEALENGTIEVSPEVLHEADTLNETEVGVMTETQDEVELVEAHVDVLRADESTYLPYEDATYELVYVVEEDGITITRYTGMASGELVIPDEIDGVPVVEIGYSAFHSGRFTGELKLPKDLTKIDEYGFFECTGFTGDLELPENLVSIEAKAFYNCTGFDGELKLPSKLTYIGNNAFDTCSRFTGDLVIPASVTSIGDMAFEDSTGFDGRLILSEGLISIGEEAFEGCSGFTGELVIPEGVTSVGVDAFAACEGFTGDLVIPRSLTTIPAGCFWECTGLDGKLVLQEGLTTIEKSAFYYCTGLSGELIIPDSVTTLESACFDTCKGFTGELVLPEGLDELGIIAFYGCSGFTSLKIPESFTSITGFNNCTGLKTIEFPKSLKSIEGFKGCTGLEGELELPEGLVNIGDGAFEGCTGLSGELKLPENLKSVGSSAFRGCTGLVGELKIPENVTSIGNVAFYGCIGLEGELKLPEGLTNIGAYTFYNCTGLSGKLVIPESVTSIGQNAFYDCTGLDGDIFVPKSVTTIGENALYNIESVVIHGVTGSYAEAYAETNGYEFIPWGTSKELPDDFEQEATVAEGEFWMLVIDEAARPIEDAEVSVTLGGEAYPFTYENGTIMMEATEEQVEITVSKLGMATKSRTLTPESGDGGYIKLFYEEDAIIITKVMLEEQGIDLTRDKHVVYTSEASDAANSTLTIETSREGATSYQLVQGGKVLAESATNRISVNLEEVLTAGGGNVELVIKINKRTLDWEQLNFKIIGERWSREEQEDSLEIGSTIKFPVPEDVPFFGGSELELDTGVDIPVQLTVEGDEVKLYLGGAKDLLDDGDDEEDEDDKSLQEKLADLKDEFKKEKKAADVSSAYKGGNVAGFDVSLELSGYGEGTIDIANSMAAVEVGICLEMTASNGITWYTFIGPIPIYISIDGELDASGEAVGNLTVKDGKLQNATLDLGHEIAVTLGAGAGVGLNDVACIEVNGSGTLGWEHQAATMGYKNGIFAEGASDTVTLQGALEARGVLFFLSHSKEWPSNTYQLYPNPTAALKVSEAYDVHDASAYKVMARDYVLESTLSGEFSPVDVLNAAENMTEISEGVTVLRELEDDTQVIINGLYPDAKPQAVTFMGVDYLFYLDDQAERGDEDRTALVYRMRTEEGWSEAKLVTDDATADFDFEVCVAEDGIYVVWQNATESMISITTLEEVVTRLELQAAKVAGEEITMLAAPATTEGLAPVCPSLVNYDGKIWACWFENSENNLLENYYGVNSFYAQALNEQANDTDVNGAEVNNVQVNDAEENRALEVLENQEERITLAVTDMGVTTADFGILKDTLWGAFTADTDEDMSTVADREVYFMQEGTAYQVTDNEVVDSNPQFGTIDDEQVVVYYADGNFVVTEGLEGIELPEQNENIQSADAGGNTVVITDKITTTNILEEQSGTVSDSFQFISNGSSPVIVWKDAYVIGENAGQALTMMCYENGSWGTPFEAATTQDSLVAFTVLTGNGSVDAENEVANGTESDEETVTLIYTARGDLDGQEITRLYEVEAQERGSAVITKLEYEENDYESGVEFPMGITLVNNSGYTAEKVELVIVDAEGNTVFSQASEEGLEVGTESLVTLTGFAPEDTGDLQNFTLLVYADDKLCDTHDFALGGADFLVTEKTTYDETEEILNLKVKNQTKFAGSVKMTVTPEGEEAAILEKEYTDIPAGSSVNYFCKLDELWEQTTADTLVVQVTSTGRTEATTIDNTAKLYNFERQTETVTVDLEQEDVELQPGETLQLTATVGPEDAEDKTLYYSSNNEESVTVDENGLLTAVGEGIATITVSTVDGFTDNCVVTVAYHEVESITLSQEMLTMKIGESATITAQVTPEDAKDKTLTWTSSDETVVAVANGTVKAVDGGTAIITVTAVNGASAVCTITVDEKPYPFTDLPVNEEDWKYISANYVYQRAIMSGVDEVTFAPDMVMNRAMFVQMLYSMEQKPEVTYEEVFADVAEDAWYSSAVIWAVNNEVTAGVGEGMFGSDTEISREQLALLLYKYAQLEGYDVSGKAELDAFTDSAETADWATEAIQWAVNEGIISGKPQEDGSLKLDPKATATRAECAAMMRKYCMEYVE